MPETQTYARHAQVNSTIITLAKLAAIKAVKRGMHAQGLKVAQFERTAIVSIANEYLSDHPELLAEAAETVRKVPQLRTLAEREERRRRRKQR